METQWTRMTANEAAEIIQHNDMEIGRAHV